MNEKYMNVFSRNGWNVVYSDKNQTELESYSPAGEDLILDVGNETIVSDILQELESFDPDEHIEMWLSQRITGKDKSVPNAYILTHDAYEIKAMLEHLYEEMRKVEI